MNGSETAQAPPAKLPLNLGILDQRLKDRLSARSDTPSLDSKVLLAHILGQPKPWVIAHPEYQLNSHEMTLLREAVEHLDNGVPLPYVLGTWEFFGLTFKVSEDVLIPRPETELLVETAIDWLGKHPAKRRAVDIGTGSGCIAVALAKSVPDLQVIATDISFASLEIAKENILLHDAANQITLAQSDLFIPMADNYDLICANLPYIPSRILQSLPLAAHEPLRALDGGPDGLTVILRMLEEATNWINPGGLLLLEIEPNQGTTLLAFAERIFPGADAKLSQDLAGFDRLVVIQTPE